MAIILSLETSADACSAALHQNGELIKEEVVHEPQAHASKLAPLVERLFSSTAMPKNDLDAVAVSAGPGSYTGLRIGVSMAKGLCFALDLPLISIPTLTLLAAQGKESAQIPAAFLCPMIDARRMEVYTQLFDPELKTVSAVEAKIVDEDSYRELLSHHTVLFFGNGSAKCKAVITSSNARFFDGVSASASSMGKLAFTKYIEGHVENLELYTPFYLKEFAAKTSKPLL